MATGVCPHGRFANEAPFHMPLRKLWNAFRGRTPSDGTPSEPTTQKTKSAATARVEHVSAHQPPVVGAKPALGIFRLGRGPHDPLCRAIRKSGATSVLDISVEDGTRAIAVVEALSKADPNATIRYAAVDQFELAGGVVSLMQFHRNLRKHAIRPQIFPLDVATAVVRVAYTIGAVDLVLIGRESTELTALSDDQWNSLLRRVTHPDSLVLRQRGESWDRFEIAGATHAAISPRRIIESIGREWAALVPLLPSCPGFSLSRPIQSAYFNGSPNSNKICVNPGRETRVSGLVFNGLDWSDG